MLGGLRIHAIGNIKLRKDNAVGLDYHQVKPCKVLFQIQRATCDQCVPPTSVCHRNNCCQLVFSEQLLLTVFFGIVIGTQTIVSGHGNNWGNNCYRQVFPGNSSTEPAFALSTIVTPDPVQLEVPCVNSTNIICFESVDLIYDTSKRSTVQIFYVLRRSTQQGNKKENSRKFHKRELC